MNEGLKKYTKFWKLNMYLLILTLFTYASLSMLIAKVSKKPDEYIFSHYNSFNHCYWIVFQNAGRFKLVDNNVIIKMQQFKSFLDIQYIQILMPMIFIFFRIFNMMGKDPVLIFMLDPLPGLQMMGIWCLMKRAQPRC